jgi:hypothetical protein
MSQPSNNKRKPVRVLSRLRVSEVSVVDRGAGEGCHVMLRKRNGKPDYEAFFGKIFGVEKKRIHGGYPMPDMGVKKNTDDILSDFADDDDETERLSADADRDDDERPDGGEPEEYGAPTDNLERLRDAMKSEDAMRDPMRRLKSLDAVQICKTMSNEGNAFGLSEHDLVSLIDNYAKAHGKSFVDIFTAQDEVGLACRKAVDIAKNAQFVSRTSTMSKAGGMPGRATLTPRSSGFSGKPAQQNVNNPKSALAALQELVDAQRAANPALSESQAWQLVYTHPDNAGLAARERAENRPVATAW